jgi:putative PIN family toxin of toxin-antitoxin system
MKIFIDTNVLISAFISHGACNELFVHCMTRHHVYTSEFVLQELARTLSKKFKYPADEIEQARKIILSGAVVVAEADLNQQISKDEDDDHIIAAAIHADVDCIVSGDDDLLNLKKIQDIRILSPRDFWVFEEVFFQSTD